MNFIGRRVGRMCSFMCSYSSDSFPKCEIIFFHLSALGASISRKWAAHFIFYCFGINNRTASACFFSLAVDSCFGVSPPYFDSVYDLSATKRGTQLRYLVFPKTELCEARFSAYNRAHILGRGGNGVIQISVDELGAPRQNTDSVACVNYLVDRDCRVLEAQCDDQFKAAYRVMVAQGLLKPVDWPEYERTLASRVRYWADTGWTAPTSARE